MSLQPFTAYIWPFFALLLHCFSSQTTSLVKVRGTSRYKTWFFLLRDKDTHLSLSDTENICFIVRFLGLNSDEIQKQLLWS